MEEGGDLKDGSVEWRLRMDGCGRIFDFSIISLFLQCYAQGPYFVERKRQKRLWQSYP